MQGFDSRIYTSQSVLSSGLWVKVKVSTYGFQFIPSSVLAQWGFPSPDRVKIFGYGCRAESDILNESTFIDDLPQIPTLAIDDGLIFFADGPVMPMLDKNNIPSIDTNPYSSTSFYYLTADCGEPLTIKAESIAVEPSQNAELFTVVWHQTERFSPGETGQLLVGEDFKTMSHQSFTLSTPGALSGGTATASIPFLANSSGGSSTLTVDINGTTNQFTIQPTTDIKYDFGKMINPVILHKITQPQTSVNLSITTSGQLLGANLDYIAISYPIDNLDQLKNPIIYSKGGSFSPNDNLVFDITDPKNISSVTALLPSSNFRRYQIINSVHDLPAPTYDCIVPNQNIHSNLSLPQMIIISPDQWKTEANRLARLHSNDITTIILSDREIYNEFSSGRFDPSAIRKCLKMFYDRGIATGSPLKYVILFGRSIFDNRQLTAEGQTIKYPILPSWQSANSMSDATSFTTDDYFAILSDDSGRDMAHDTLSIALGRIPVTTMAEAKNIVDKIANYISSNKTGQWKSKALMLADDDDGGCHLDYAESMIDHIKQSGGSDITFSKIYLDAFKKVNGAYPDARKLLDSELKNGVAWWTFLGHAAPTSLTADRLLTYNDIAGLNLSITPAILAFTCDFLRCDNPTVSGGEMLFNNPQGGVIAAISATRPVNIYQNGLLAESFGNYIYSRDQNGQSLTVGEIYQKAKNNYQSGRSNENKLRYVLIGDPALKISRPSNRVAVSSINDIAIDSDTPPTFGSSSRVTIKGNITTSDGSILSDFSGSIYTRIYDAVQTITTNGNGSNGVKSVYDTEGQLLYSGVDTVIDGSFSATAFIPVEIADNYRNATISQYAVNPANGSEAAGIETRFYIYGRGNDINDSIAPVIEQMYLNHPSFKPGDTVNPSPTVYIQITDDTSIDITSTSIGNRMQLKLDDLTLPDLSLYYQPLPSVGESGLISYPLQSIDDGYHTLSFEVSDIAGNRAEKTIGFISKTGYKPHIFKVYTNRQPAIDQANFYIVHDRPDITVDATIDIFDIMGNRLWSHTRRGRGDTLSTNPITWNLHDRAGRRVPRGIYIYRCTITELGGTRSDHKSDKIAVSY